MASSSTLLSLVLLLSASWGMVHAGVTHTRLYMYETVAGPDATLLATVLPPQASKTTFGMLGLLDDELYDGRDPSYAKLLGRFQGLVAFAGLANPPGMQSLVSFIFTAGKYNGSTLVMAGTVVDFEVPFERAIVGGTGKFRMAQGWCIIKADWQPTELSTVYEVNLFVKTTEEDQMVLRMDA